MHTPVLSHLRIHSFHPVGGCGGWQAAHLFRNGRGIQHKHRCVVYQTCKAIEQMLNLLSIFEQAVAGEGNDSLLLGSHAPCAYTSGGLLLASLCAHMLW